ncbi:MAG: hypothetical protein J3K34DRAFT_405680 [Monoraphidium minutum]|nr:MAG: hypothetical protein J3K34DRAFT_405680 [Monoraphidium minutum]
MSVWVTWVPGSRQQGPGGFLVILPAAPYHPVGRCQAPHPRLATTCAALGARHTARAPAPAVAAAGVGAVPPPASAARPPARPCRSSPQHLVACLFSARRPHNTCSAARQRPLFPAASHCTQRCGGRRRPPRAPACARLRSLRPVSPAGPALEAHTAR